MGIRQSKSEHLRASTGDGRSDHPGHTQGRRRLAIGTVRKAEIERGAPARRWTLKRTDVPMLTRNFDSSEVDSA
jgi:hypothetical protein